MPLLGHNRLIVKRLFSGCELFQKKVSDAGEAGAVTLPESDAFQTNPRHDE